MMLDVAGLTNTRFHFISDEYLIRSVLEQRVHVLIHIWCRENMITSKSSRVFGGVYKMAAMKDGQIVPKSDFRK